MSEPKHGGCGRALVSLGRVARGARTLTVRAAMAAVLVGGVLHAADDNQIIFPGGATKAAPPSAAGGDSLNLITLLIAVTLAAVGGWMFWRNRHRTAGGRESRLLAIEETRSLGNRQYLVVASYEDKKFLLGVCQGRIDMLSRLDDEGDRSKGTP